MDQYSPTYSNDRAAKDQTALLVALSALLLAALAVVFGLAQSNNGAGTKDQLNAVQVSEVAKGSSAMTGTISGVLVAPNGETPVLVGGPNKESYPWIKGHVTAMLQTDVGLWAATSGPGDAPATLGLVRNPIGENPFVQQIALPPNFAGAEIRALVQGLGRLYIGTSKGLLTWDFGRLGAFNPPSRFRLPNVSGHMDVTALYLDAVGTLWIGTREGLISYNGTEAFRHTIKEGLPSNVVTALSGDIAGLLYVGTDKGLAALDRGVWIRHAEVDGQVNAVLAADENVWVGTTDGLYQRLEGKWAHFDEKSKLPSGNITGLAWSGDGIYIGTDAGLYKVNVITVPATPEIKPEARTEGHVEPRPETPAEHGEAHGH